MSKSLSFIGTGASYGAMEYFEIKSPLGLKELLALEKYANKSKDKQTCKEFLKKVNGVKNQNFEDSMKDKNVDETQTRNKCMRIFG